MTPAIDRYDMGIAFQVWQKFFSLALYVARCVSNVETDWEKHRESAMEYLARGRLMEAAGHFLDGVETGIGAKAEEGMRLIRDDVDSMNAELDAAEVEATKLLRDRCADLDDQPPGFGVAELLRVPEMTAEHRQWFTRTPAPELADTFLEGPPPAVETPEAQARRLKTFWR